MKKIMFVIPIIIFCIFLISSANSFKKNESGGEKIKVFVQMNNERQVGFFRLNKIDLTSEEKEQTREEIVSELGKEKIRHVFSDSFSAEISESDLKNLKKDFRIKSVIEMNDIHAFLQDSAGIVNATSTWPIQINGVNITGESETICVVDTGINFSHPDLQGKNLTCNIDCINKNCVENCSISDDYGHGTHVAGIIAANGSIKGIAPDAKIVAVKVLDASGGGYPDDLKSGIDWCISNALTYNISVISMSLGCNATKDGYTSYCDSEADGCLSDPLVSSVNNAVSRNISVIAATGNDANFSAIAAPACIQNATAVAASDKNDNIWGNSNRNILTDLIAPGININSTSISGAYEQRSGTSMAAPHVAAAFALVRQFKRLEKNEVLKPSEIQDALNSTGKSINDASSGLNFSRIDVYTAILSLDESLPNVSLIQPADNSVNISQNHTFKCNATDLQLKNITLHVWNSSALYYNATDNADGSFAEREFNLTNMPLDNYKWNCLVYDEQGNSAYAESNFTIKIGDILVDLTSPENNGFVNSGVNFTCNARGITGTELSNITFYLWNSTGIVTSNTSNVSGMQNSTNFFYNFIQEREYSWNCFVYNNQSNSSFAESNFTITYDETKPAINLITPLNSSTHTASNVIDFYYNVTDTNQITNCSLIINSKINKTIENPNKGVASNITSYLANADYNWSINCTDAANNKNSSETRSLAVQYTIQQQEQQTSSGGGGGTISPRTYVVSEEQLKEGYTKTLSVREKIKFSIGKEEHILELNKTTENSATIKISSNTIIVILFVNETRKFDLNSDRYYETQVTLEEIKNKKASLKINEINEAVESEEKKKEDEQARQEKIIAFNKTEESMEGTYKIAGRFLELAIVAVILIAIIIFLIADRKKRREKLKKQRH